MGRHGENIRKRSDGRWEARYMAYNEEKGKKICQMQTSKIKNGVSLEI